jgi:hypothetical protein
MPRREMERAGQTMVRPMWAAPDDWCALRHGTADAKRWQRADAHL